MKTALLASRTHADRAVPTILHWLSRGTPGLFALFVWYLTGCGDSLVGGRCAPGYHPRIGQGCIRWSTDASHPDDSTLDGDTQGIDSGTTDSTTTDDHGEWTVPDGPPNPDAPNNTDATTDGLSAMDGTNGSTDTGPWTDASSDVPGSDGGPCPVGQTRCDGVCVNTDTNASHCGACGRACGPTQVCARGVCTLSCTPPLSACGSSCVDHATDPNHCGRCDNVCPSGVCNAGTCRGARAGHLVLIGHSFERTRADQDRILGNAVFLSSRNPTRVLVYEGFADTAPGGAVEHANAAIDRTASGRSWTRTVLASTTASSEISIDRYDVVLIYEQTHATDEQIASIALDMGDALRSFVQSGGVVIVLDGPTRNRGTWPIVHATGLLPVSGVTVITNRPVTVTMPADALAVGVSSTYNAERTSVRFTTMAPYTVFADSDGPVVLHRAVIP